MPDETVSYDWMDITERGVKTLVQAAVASGGVVVVNSWISGESVEFSVLYSAVVPVVAAAISFVWNTLKGYRSSRNKELVLND